MSRLTRVLQKIFASTAPTSQIGQFGSLAAGTPTTSNDPAVIQQLSNFLGGWFDAILGSNSPAIEDMNGIHFLLSRQLAYLFQAGIPEWEAGTTYYTGSIVNASGVLYVSVADSNIGNAVTNASFWSLAINSAKSLSVDLSGVVSTILAGESITANNCVCLDLVGTSYKVFNSDSTIGTRKTSRFGFANASATIGNPVSMFYEGAMAGFSGLIPQSIYYLGAAGAITANPVDANPVVVGQALSSTVLWVDRSLGVDGFFPIGIIFVRAFGSSASESVTGGTDDVEHFNFSAWSAGTADSAGPTKLARLQAGESVLSGFLRAIDGGTSTSSGSPVLNHRIYNKISWSAGTNRTTPRSNGGVGVLSGSLCVGKGSTGGSYLTGTTALDTFNGSTWTAGAGTFANASVLVSTIVQGSKVRWICGSATSSAAQNIHETYDGSSVSSDTVPGVTGYGASGCASSGGNGVAAIDSSLSALQGTKYYNGTSWSSNQNSSYVYADLTNGTQTGPAGGFNSSSGISYMNGGSSSATVSINNSSQFSGTTWSSAPASTLARAAAAGGVF